MRSKMIRRLGISCLVITMVAIASALTGGVIGSSPAAAGDTRTAVKDGAQYDRANLIRFHVIANSDSEIDQALKRKIRDRVVERMTPEFKTATNLKAARNIAKAHLGEITAIAEEEVKKWGKDFTVKVQLGNFDFPVKTYGQLTLPAGNYEAVRIVIGKGQGANWWCVLFPPLCFTDVSKVMVQMGPGNTETRGIEQTVKVRFKILDFLNFKS